MTPAQLATLKAAILADGTLTGASAVTIAGVFNALAAPAFTVWKTSVSTGNVGKAFVATSIAGMTSANNDRLVSFALWNPDGVNPSRADQRTFFDDVFSVASGAPTRTALAALWRRFATRAEKLFATGTGSDAAPATLAFEGSISADDVREALES